MAESYKQYRRAQRNLVTEEDFRGGMRYTDSPQDPGFCKALINYDIKDNGKIITPRNGYRMLHSVNLGNFEKPKTIHHIAKGAILDTDSNEDLSRRYTFLTDAKGDEAAVDYDTNKLLIEERFSAEYEDTTNKIFIQSVRVGMDPEDPESDPEDPNEHLYALRRKPRPTTQMLHDMNLMETGVFTQQPYTPVYTVLNGKAIMGVRHYTTEAKTAWTDKLAFLNIERRDGNLYRHNLNFITPKPVSPTEAINYGYNMLSETPYTFNDSKNLAIPAGHIIMNGIVPYTDATCDQVKFNAKVGESITFRLTAQFPDEVSTYKFRWEIRELGSDTVSVYENQEDTSKVYKYNGTNALNTADNSDFIKLTMHPPYKRFSVVVIAYSTTDLTEPIQTMVLGQYSVSEDNISTTTNIEPKNYRLQNANDMTTWQQRVILWGVEGAPNMIFMSDINDPSYFPYPHNAEIFEEDVIACVPYLGDLLVFTESKLYKMTWNKEHMYFESAMIQDNLNMTLFDKDTIVLVQNMVFFKSGNYYYMVVPKTSQGSAGALQLAPISAPITALLDDFKREIKILANTLYNFDNSDRYPRVPATYYMDLQLQDYYNYLDLTAVRNVYKFQLVHKDFEANQVSEVILNFDVVLNYDTMMRTWTLYMYQSNDHRMTPYWKNITSTTVFITPRPEYVSFYNEDEELTEEYITTHLDFIKPDNLSCTDELSITGSTVVQAKLMPNHQYFDTGYRDHQTQIKKRYREIQFKINNISQKALQFGTQFLIDDQLRKNIFRYEARHITTEDAADYGYFYIEQVFDNPEIIPGATILENENPAEYDIPYGDSQKTSMTGTFDLHSRLWVLDFSQLSRVSVVKVRQRVSGKGYAPRLIMISLNEEKYEMLSHNWVHRVMNAR